MAALRMAWCSARNGNSMQMMRYVRAWGTSGGWSNGLVWGQERVARGYGTEDGAKREYGRRERVAMANYAGNIQGMSLMRQAYRLFLDASRTVPDLKKERRHGRAVDDVNQQVLFELRRGPSAHTLANALIRPSPTHGQKNDIEVPVYQFSSLPKKDVQLQPPNEKIVLPGNIFDVPIRRDIVHYVVRWQLAKRRSSVNAHTKTVSTVHGTTRKPYPQKGSGRARQGSRRGPHFRGGGIAFGPTNKKVHEIGCNRRTRRMGLTIALSAKLAEGHLLVVDGLGSDDEDVNIAKTKIMLERITQLVDEPGETNPSCLIVHGNPRPEVISMSKDTNDGFDDIEILDKIKRSALNLRSVDIIDQIGLNVYSILRRRYLVLSRAALSDLITRMSIPLKPRERYIASLKESLKLQEVSQ